jgi:hypothetical protein
MGCGLATDDRSREEGRHYTDDSAVRLHGCGAFGEAKPLKHLTFLLSGYCGSEPARDAGATVLQLHRVIVHREQARSHRRRLSWQMVKKKGLEIDLQALKR